MCEVPLSPKAEPIPSPTGGHTASTVPYICRAAAVLCKRPQRGPSRQVLSRPASTIRVCSLCPPSLDRFRSSSSRQHGPAVSAENRSEVCTHRNGSKRRYTAQLCIDGALPRVCKLAHTTTARLEHAFAVLVTRAVRRSESFGQALDLQYLKELCVTCFELLQVTLAQQHAMPPVGRLERIERRKELRLDLVQLRVDRC